MIQERRLLITASKGGCRSPHDNAGNQGIGYGEYRRRGASATPWPFPAIIAVMPNENGAPEGAPFLRIRCDASGLHHDPLGE